ncbi:hypothetical protein ACHAWF_010460 [Thalassiosira exigua]
MPNGHSRSGQSPEDSSDRPPSQVGPSTPSTIEVQTDTSETGSERIEVIHELAARDGNEKLALPRQLVPRLAKRAYHLEEGNSWCQDWIQYQRNTHPLFGICLYHPLHPIRLPQRAIILVGSIVLPILYIFRVYMGFLSHEKAGGAVNLIYDITGKVTEAQQKYTNIEIQQSLVFLVTVGSLLHSMFDMVIWYLMACFCFRPGGYCHQRGGKRSAFCKTFGIYSAVLLVMISVVAATSVAVVRLSEDQEREAASMAEKFAESQFSFLLGYALELAAALFVFYFVTSTVFFSGVLGCGRLPVLGGRPYEIWMERNRNSDDPDEYDEEDTPGLQAYKV